MKNPMHVQINGLYSFICSEDEALQLTKIIRNCIPATVSYDGNIKLNQPSDNQLLTLAIVNEQYLKRVIREQVVK